MNPYGPEFQTEFAIFLGENDLNSEKGSIYESSPDRYVPNSSPANVSKNDLAASKKTYPTLKVSGSSPRIWLPFPT